MSIAISCEDVHFSYGKEDILRGINADIKEGTISALFGPNGSGKTTLLKCLAKLYRIKKGNIKLFDKNQSSLNVQDISKLISYVPQEHTLSFPFSVKEMVMMGRTPHLGGVMGPTKEDEEATEKAMKQVGIENLSTQFYTELSGGQRQMVLISRALAQNTPIIILDEPTSALDFRNQMIVWQTLVSLKFSGKTIIVCTHDPNHVIWFCDEVFIIDHGKILNNGIVKEIMTDKMLNELYGDVCTFRNESVIPKFNLT